jgi:hypothetical protein
MTKEENAIDLVKCLLWHTRLDIGNEEQLVEFLEQRLKTGHWILVDAEGDSAWHCKCSRCGKDPLHYVCGSENWWLAKSHLPKFCPNCGARMEVEE